MLARGVLRTGKYIEWRIKRGRTYYEQQSITLAMMMTCARKFEAFQSAFPNNLVTDSGFSGEDLVSDLLGFYRVMSIHNPFHILRPLNKDEALRRWDHYGPIGSLRMRVLHRYCFLIRLDFLTPSHIGRNSHLL